MPIVFPYLDRTGGCSDGAQDQACRVPGARFGGTLQQFCGRTHVGFLSVRRQRWREAGVADILLAGRPAISRMRAREFRDRPHMQQYFQMIERP